MGGFPDSKPHKKSIGRAYRSRLLFSFILIIAFEIPIFGSRFPHVAFQFPISRLINIHVITIQGTLRTIAPCAICIPRLLEISLLMCVSALVLEARFDKFFDCPSMWESLKIFMVFSRLRAQVKWNI